MSAKLFSLAAFLIFAAVIAGCGSIPGQAQVLPAEPSEVGPDIVESLPPGSAPPAAHPATIETMISTRVLWTVSGYVLGKDSAWGAEQARALLFKGLDITESEITFDDQICRGVTFDERQVNAGDYLARRWQTTPEQLGIPDGEIQVFATNCSLPGFQEYLRLPDSRLIVPIQGVFFFFEPAVIR